MQNSLQNGMTGPVPQLPNAHMNEIDLTGRPLSLAAPPDVPTNPATQSNGIPSPPGRPFSGGMAGRPLLGSQQELPNDESPYHSPTITPSPQSQNSLQQFSPMAQLGLSPHLSAIDRATMPPLNVSKPSQVSGSDGSAHPTPTLAFQQLGHSPSGQDTSSQNLVNAHPNPALDGWIPQTQDRSHTYTFHDELHQELASYPPAVISEAKLLADLGDRDPSSLTLNQKELILACAAQLKHSSPTIQFNPIRKMNPWFDPIVVHDGPSLDTT